MSAEALQIEPEVDSLVVINAVMTPFLAQAREWEQKVAGVTDPKLARASRLTLKSIRVEASKAKDALKADVLKRGRAIDSAYNQIEAAIKPLELKLEEVEKAEERKEAARVAAIIQSRSQVLREMKADPSFYALGTMPEEAFLQLVETLRIAEAARIEAAAKAEAERAAKAEQERVEREARAKADAEERARIQAENERLRAEALQRELDAKKEREKLDAERRKLEAAARAEREAREKIEAEQRAAAECERQRIKAEAEAQRIAAAKPEAQKLKDLAACIRAITLPTLESKAGVIACSNIAAKIEETAQFIESRANQMVGGAA